MDCVYEAYLDYMDYYGVRTGAKDRLVWRYLKWYTHGGKPQYTFGGVAPFIVQRLAYLHGLTCGTFYRVYTPEHYIAVAKEHYKNHFWLMNIIIKNTEWVEVDKIRGFPGIYLLLTNQHAVFSESVPTYGTPIMLIQIW